MKELVQSFWKCISEAKFDELDTLFNADARVFLPNTREEFENPHLYIEFNKAYPGRWYADIEKLVQSEQLVISTTRIFSSTGSPSF